MDSTPEQAPVTQEQRLALLQQIISRSRLGHLGGIQYGGLRDIYTVAGYPKQVTFEHYWGLYTRGDIAGRIVDMPSKTTWRTPPDIREENMNTDGTEFTKAFKKLAKRLKVWSYFERLDRLAGIGRYAVMMIGVKGYDDQSLKLPLTSVPNSDALIYLSVYNEKNAQIQEWETDPGNDRFGLPKLYKLNTTNENSNFNVKGKELLVHSSRVIHAAENVLEDDTFGRPRLERPLNRLFDLDKVSASTAEAYWQQVTQVLQAKIDKDAELTPEELKELDEKLGEMVHDLRRQFYGRGIELQYLNTTTPNVSQVADLYFSLIAGSAEIPKRILFGSEMGELASTADQENYYGRINERQEQFAEPAILRAFIDRMISWGALPKPKKDGDYQVAWPPLYEESGTEKADTNLKTAQSAAALTPVGGNPRELVEIDAEGMITLVEREPDEPPPEPILPIDPLHPDPNAPPEASGGNPSPNNPNNPTRTQPKAEGSKANPAAQPPAAGG